MKIVMVKIRIASAKLAANPMSRIHAGIGSIIMTMIAISANARRMVGWNKVEVLKVLGIKKVHRLAGLLVAIQTL